MIKTGIKIFYSLKRLRNSESNQKQNNYNKLEVLVYKSYENQRKHDCNLLITDHVGDLIQSAEFVEADRQSFEVNQGLDRLQFADSIVVEI